jgi:hypothetical protein
VKKATTYVELMSPGPKRDRSFAEITMLWARDEPEQVAAWVQQLPSDMKSDPALQSLAQLWSKTDPKAAARWFAQNNDYRGRTRDLAWIVQAWAMNNAGEALAWIETLPPNKETDSLMTIALASLAESEPQTAISSLDGIASNDVRNRTAGAIAIHLLGRIP